MPYQNDTATLASIVSPAYAGGQAMEQADLENQANQIKNQVSQGTMAADIAKPGLQNMFTQAQTNAEQGLAKSQNAKGDVDQALTPGNIQLGQAKNQTQISSEKLQQFQQMGTIANQAAGIMDGIPPAARPAAMQQLAQKYGVDPEALGPLAGGDPDQLRKFSQGLIQGTSDYTTKLMQAQQHNIGAANVADIQGSSRVAGAVASANARIEAANIVANQRKQQQTFEQAAVQAYNAGHKDIGDAYTQAAQNLKQAQAGITAQLVGQQLPNINFPQSTTQPAPQQGGNAVEAEMRRRGLIK